MSVPSERVAEWRDAAQVFARTGGDLTLQWFRRADLTVEVKADESPVTVADRAAETAIRAAIASRYPDHTIVGEEHGGTIRGTGCEWIVDPIDGTKSFVRGVALYTTLIALLVDGRPEVGVIYSPATGEVAAAGRGIGAVDELGRPIHVSGCTTLSDAWAATTDPVDLARREPHLFRRLIDGCQAMRTWADGYGYMMLAGGRLDIMVDPIMSPWDVAPLSVIITEAGGTFADLQGARDGLGTSAVATASPALESALLSS